QRRGARSGGVAYCVRTIVIVVPEDFAVGCVEAQDPFAARDDPARERIGRIVGALGKLAVSKINPAMRHSRTGVTRSNGRPPKDRRAFCWKFLDDSGFAPDRVALRAEPLRPIIGPERASAEPYECKSGRAKGSSPIQAHEQSISLAFDQGQIISL